MRALLGASLLVLTACQEQGLLDSFEIPTLDLELDTPTYGSFAGAGDARVAGTVHPPEALLRVEGQLVEVAPDGTFEVFLPFDRPYRIVEVSAEAYEQRQDLRLPVFAGFDPLDTWPGAVTLRLTPHGLDGLARVLEASIRDLLAGLGTGAIPPVDVNGFTIEVAGVEVGDLEVELDAGSAGIEVEILIEDVVLSTVTRGVAFEQPLEVPGSIAFPQVGLASDLSIEVDDEGGLVAGIGEPEVDFELPVVTFGQADLGWLSDLIATRIDLEALLQEQIAAAVGDGAGLPLGGPLAFETEALGTTLAIALLDARTDVRGLGFGLGVGIGEPVPSTASDVPLPPGDFVEPVDLSVAVHDGVLQVLLESDLLALLEQDIQIPGQLGFILDPLIEGLPGGSQVPDHAGWCIRIEPGEAKVARFGVGDGPLAGIYLPDAQVSFLYTERSGGSCEPWLSTSLALEVLVDLDGTELGIDMQVPEGIVLAYGTELEADEELELVQELGGTLERLLGLLGGGLGGFDLGDLLGGGGGGGADGGLGGLPLDGLQLQVGERRLMRDAQGVPIEGMVELGVQLFADEP